jgi:hypothetical protein
MSALRWAAAVPVIVGVLMGNVALAAADEPAPTPTPIPTPAEEPTPGPTTPVTYVTTITTTTTTVNAPITVVAAPITTTINNATGGGSRRLVLYLSGCGRSPIGQRDRGRKAHVRLAPNATLLVRVNGRRVASLRLPSSTQRHPRGVALRLRLAPNGTLTIRRPSGRVMAVQGCAPV